MGKNGHKRAKMVTNGQKWTKHYCRRSIMLIHLIVNAKMPILKSKLSPYKRLKWAMGLIDFGKTKVHFDPPPDHEFEPSLIKILL